MTGTEPPFSYDEIADAYAAAVDAAPYNAFYERPAMLALLPEIRGARVLDAGCGSGWYTEQLLERGAHVTAIDGSAAMVRHARERLAPWAQRGHVLLGVGDLARPLDFASDGSFDGIFSALVLHYLRDWEPTLAEFRRVLAPGGWLQFSTHYPLPEATRLGTRRYQEVEPVEDDWGRVGTVRFYRRPLSAIVNALVDAGFRVERLVEPIPTEQFRAAKPESYERLLRQPEFLLFRVRPA